MARIERELPLAGEQFVEEFEGYKAHRHANKFPQAVDAARSGKAQGDGPVRALADAYLTNSLII